MLLKEALIWLDMNLLHEAVKGKSKYSHRNSQVNF